MLIVLRKKDLKSKSQKFVRFFQKSRPLIPIFQVLKKRKSLRFCTSHANFAKFLEIGAKGRDFLRAPQVPLTKSDLGPIRSVVLEAGAAECSRKIFGQNFP